VIYDAVKNKGGLFLTNINLYPTMLAAGAHLMLPAAHAGEMNLTSMNGERRIRLSEQFMASPGSAKPDCLIAADIANTIRNMSETQRNQAMAKRSSGFDWKSDGGRLQRWLPLGGPSWRRSPRATAAIDSATYSTLFAFKPATHMRPERTRYTACSSRSRSTSAAVRPV